MHILIALITAFAGLIWALVRLQNSGVNINALNPFAWMRRRAWEKKAGVKPLHAIEDTMEAAAVLLVGLLKEKGDISIESKQSLLELFQAEFGIDEAQASEMFSVSTFKLKDILSLPQEVKYILKPNQSDFQTSQINSLLAMMDKVANFEGLPTDVQTRTIKEVKKALKVA